MLRWTIIFLVLAIISAIFAWGNIASTSVEDIAKITFYASFILFVLSLFAGCRRFSDETDKLDEDWGF
jgi:uncharacterized membrane protein YtjA (UPF0391 family)